MFSYGTLYKVTLYGESHSKYIGVIIEGIKAGVKIDFNKVNEDLDKRRSGALGTTSRAEKDELIIVSGIYQGLTNGGPLNIMIENIDVDSKTYQDFVFHPRPSHSDLVAKEKYNGYNDPRGSGFFSGRLTTLIVIAGSIAKQLMDLKFEHELIQVGELKDMSKLDSYLETIKEKNDSVGGIVNLRVNNMKKGLGEPFFGKLNSMIASILFAIPAVKGLEFGVGFKGINMLGSEFNDLIIDSSGKTSTNNAGGINAGISNGNPLDINVFVKPASSIGRIQETYNFKENKVIPLSIKGRHDACIARRIGIVLECALAIAIFDAYLLEQIND